jgi:Fe-S-cluster containining protein
MDTPTTTNPNTADTDLVLAFRRIRQEHLNQTLLRLEDLQQLRARVDEAIDGRAFCDGCGFCCTSNVPLTRMEFARIEPLLRADPSLLRHQGLACPFLQVDRARFNRNLAVYNRKHLPLEANPCSIYEERPLICRMFPAPNHKTCRNHSTLEAPEINEVLKQEDAEEFPQLLIQRYYITMDWEITAPADPLDPELRFHLTLGWWVDREDAALRCRSGPNWLGSAIPAAFPVPYECELEDWAVDLFIELETPQPYLPLLERFADRASLTELTTALTQAELAGIVTQVNAGQQQIPRRGIWDWLVAA